MRVSIVTFDGGFLAQAYVRQTHLRWPLLIDRDRRLYRAYSFERGTWWRVIGPASIWGYMKLILKGRIPQKSGSDYLQLGGDVLIDPAGVVRIHHASRTPHDRPSVDSLLAPVRGAQS